MADNLDRKVKIQVQLFGYLLHSEMHAVRAQLDVGAGVHALQHGIGARAPLTTSAWRRTHHSASALTPSRPPVTHNVTHPRRQEHLLLLMDKHYLLNYLVC